MISDAPNSRVAAPFDRQALYGHADAYLAALAARDVSRLPWAERVVFTENNVQLALGDGAWNTDFVFVTPSVQATSTTLPV